MEISESRAKEILSKSFEKKLSLEEVIRKSVPEGDADTAVDMAANLINRYGMKVSRAANTIMMHKATKSDPNTAIALFATADPDELKFPSQIALLASLRPQGFNYAKVYDDKEELKDSDPTTQIKKSFSSEINEVDSPFGNIELTVDLNTLGAR
jgi:hypothetical protein